MSLAVKLNRNNVIDACIEIPDEEDDNAYGFINYVLNNPGNWITTKSFTEKTGVKPGIYWVYIPDKDYFVCEKPFDDWILNDELQWEPPVQNNLRNMNFGYDNEVSSGPSFYWNTEKKMWGHRFIEHHLRNENTRNDGIYFISKCSLNNNFTHASDYVYGMNVECLPKAFKYIDLHPDWEPGFIYPVYRETFAKKYGVTNDNPDRFLSHEKYIVPFDGSPYFFIHFTNLCDLNKKRKYFGDHEYIRDHLYEVSVDFENEFVQQHPHIAGRTISELFKLIIDWDLSYLYFENRENTANLCHNIMMSIDMPKEIYDDIYYNTPDSMIAKYLKNNKNARDLPERPVTNNNVIEWFCQKYWDLRYTKDYIDDNIKLLNTNYYHITL